MSRNLLTDAFQKLHDRMVSGESRCSAEARSEIAILCNGFLVLFDDVHNKSQLGSLPLDRFVKGKNDTEMSARSLAREALGIFFALELADKPSLDEEQCAIAIVKDMQLGSFVEVAERRQKASRSAAHAKKRS